MQSFITFITEQAGHFVAVKPTPDSMNEIDRIITSLNIMNPVPKKDLHCTLMYSRKDLNSLYSASKDTYDAMVTSIGFLNGVIVLFLQSANLQLRFNELKLLCGGVSDYPDFIPHITLSYQKNQLLSNNNIKPFYIQLTHEYCDTLKD